MEAPPIINPLRKVILSVDSLRSFEGGPSRSVPALARALAAIHVPVELWSLSGEELVEGVEVKRFASSKEIVSALAKQDREGLVLHDNGLWRPFNWWLCRAAQHLGIPYIISARGMLEPWSLKQAYWKKKLAWHLYQQSLLKGAAMIHATSDLEATNIRKLGLETKLVVQPNGVDIPEATVREERSMKVVLYLSRLHPKKGLEMLLDVWAQLQMPNWKLKIAGGGEPAYVRAVRAKADLLGISPRVEWLGELDDKLKWHAMGEADFFVLPSFSENFGIVVAEALAAGLPVVTTTATPWQSLASTACGRCVPPEPKALEAAMREIMEMSHERRVAKGVRGRAWMEQSFSWSSVAQGMLKAYTSVLG